MPRYYVKNRRPSCQFLSTRRERREFGLGRGSRPWLPVVFIAVISVPGRYHQRYHYYRACTLSVSFTVARLWKLMINFPTLSRSARVWCRSALSLRTPRHALVFPRRPTDDGLFLARWRRDLDQFNVSRLHSRLFHRPRSIVLIWCNDIGRGRWTCFLRSNVGTSCCPRDDDNDDDHDDDDDDDDDLYFWDVIFFLSFLLSWMEFIPRRGIVS